MTNKNKNLEREHEPEDAIGPSLDKRGGYIFRGQKQRFPYDRLKKGNITRFETDEQFKDDSRSRMLLSMNNGKGMQRLCRKWQGRPVNIFKWWNGHTWEYVTSVNANFRRFCAELAETLNNTYPPSVSDEGFLTEGWGDWSRIVSVAGIKPTPDAVPTVSNEEFISRDGGVVSWDSVPERHRVILNTIFELFFGIHEFTDARISRKSSSTVPFFVNDDVAIKKALVNNALVNSREIFELSSQGRLKELFDKHRVAHVYTAGGRTQPDTSKISKGKVIPKERKVLDWNGNMVVQDKIGPVKEYGVIGAAMRARRVFGYAGMPSYLLTCLFSGFRGFADRFEFTFKHRGHSHVESKITGYCSNPYVIGTDATQFDSSFEEWFFRAFESYIAEKYHPVVADFLAASFRAAFVTGRISDHKGDSPLWAGDPFDIEDTIFYGNASGHPLTSEMNKAKMVFAMLTGVDDVLSEGGSSLESVTGKPDLASAISSILTGNEEFAFLNMGDDNVTLYKDSAAWYMTEVINRIKSGGRTLTKYVSLDIESPISFLGGVFTKRPENGGAIKIEQALPSWFRSLFCREHDIDNPIHSPYGSAGALVSRDTYALCYKFRDIEEISLALWKKHFGTSVPTYIQMLHQDAADNPIPECGLSDVDQLVRANPDYIHYKVDVNDVSTEVLDSISVRIPADVIKRHLSWVFDPILDKQLYGDKDD